MVRSRILCLLPDLNGGGAERVMLYLVAGLDRARWDVTLGLARKHGPYVPLIPRDISVLEFRKDRAAQAVLDIARALRAGRYDVCFSMVSMNLAAVLAGALARTHARVVLSARNHYSKSLPAEASGSALKMAAIRFLYPRADAVACVSRGVADDLITKFSVPADKALVIHNPIDIARVQAQAAEPCEHPWLPATAKNPVLAAVGKLQVAKGYPYLLEAFLTIRKARPGTRLLILGEGPERARIEGFIAAHGLADEVALAGFHTNPYRFLSRATLFVHAALWEGFPNVLVEAMACGLPVVSTDCPSGPSEIVTPGRDGLLVPVADPGALAEAALSLLDEPHRARAMADAGRETVERFSVGRVVARYAALFENVISADG